MDLNFYDVIKELNNKKINYWVCHGSLLGLARDGKLIPWDHDADIAIWENEYSKNYIIEIFKLIGFEFNKNHPEGSLNFKRKGGRSIDVNLYKQSDNLRNLVSALHLVPNTIVFDILDRIVNKKKFNGKSFYLIIFNFIKIFRIFLIPPYHLLNKFGFLYSYKGYSTPKDLLIEFIDFDYFGISCRIPKMYKSINSYIYGDNWIIPIKKYNWMKDSRSVISKDLKINS